MVGETELRTQSAKPIVIREKLENCKIERGIGLFFKYLVDNPQHIS